VTADGPGDPRDRLAAVAGEIRSLVRKRAASESQERLLMRVLGGGEHRPATASPLHPITAHLPGLVHGALTGTEAAALPIAAAGTMVHVGADVLDDLMDGDGPPAGLTVAEAMLVGAGLIGPLPVLALAELDAPEARRARIAKTFAEALVVMGAGQAGDLAEADGGVRPVGEAVQIAALKSGALLSGLSRGAAILAGANDDVVSACGRFGDAVGTAAQLRHDMRKRLAELRTVPPGDDAWVADFFVVSDRIARTCYMNARNSLESIRPLSAWGVALDEIARLSAEISTPEGRGSQ
jgi:hypothetical protein